MFVCVCVFNLNQKPKSFSGQPAGSGKRVRSEIFGPSFERGALDFPHLPLLALSLEESKSLSGSIAGINLKSILKASSLHLCGTWASCSPSLPSQAESSDPVSTYTSPFLWSALNSDPPFGPVSWLPSALSIYSIHPYFMLYFNPDSTSFHHFLEPSSCFLGPHPTLPFS